MSSLFSHDCYPLLQNFHLLFCQIDHSVHSFIHSFAKTTMNIDDKHFSSTAMIQLSLNTSENHLTVKSKCSTPVVSVLSRSSVHLVIRVKGLRVALTNILVKMTLIPDRKPLECQTRAVDNRSGSCVFNEQFTFEINEEDTTKRLCFSVYEYERSQMHLQGCLSFGIRNTISKQRVRSVEFIPKRDGHVRCWRSPAGFISCRKTSVNSVTNKFDMSTANK